MSAYLFTPPPVPSVAIKGRETRWPVRRIFCVGKNYADHVAEMGGDPQPPVFFTKPADAVFEGGDLPYPSGTQNLHYEAELVVAIGTGGRAIAASTALDHIAGYAVGNDLTRRDLQGLAKKGGSPWDMAKGFDQSAVIGPVHLVADVGHLTDARLTCKVGDDLHQDGNIRDMIWAVPQIIEALSGLMELAQGDLIFTGTPAGVGPIVAGDTCTAAIDGLGDVSVRITAPA